MYFSQEHFKLKTVLLRVAHIKLPVTLNEVPRTDRCVVVVLSEGGVAVKGNDNT